MSLNTWQAPNTWLDSGLILTVENGDFTTTFQSVDLLFNRSLIVGGASYATNFQDATLVYTTVGQYTLIANSGEYTTDGQDISFFYNRAIMIQSGDFITTGYNVSLLYSGQPSQIIGTVTAGFKPNSIIVSFKD